MKLFSIFKETSNTFQGQEPDECVIIFLRRHPIVVLLRVFGLLVAFLFSIVISAFLVDFIIANDLVVIYLFIMSTWALFVWVLIFYAFTMYTLDVWIVTNHRIIDSTQHGFFNRTVSELHTSRIQDIYVNTDGTVQTLLNFGDLYIQTAGTEERFKFLQIPDPVGVKDKIMKMTFPEDYRDRK